jgi:hydroxymethylglutaryl-CoA lyase
MITDYSQTLIVQEVSPRDGLQIEPTWVETADKIVLINQLSQAGFSRIEARLVRLAQSHSGPA